MHDLPLWQQLRQRALLPANTQICRTHKHTTMSTFIDFIDKSVTYDTFVRDVATSVVRLLSEVRNDPEYISKRRAYKLFGRGNVDRWLKNEDIKPHIRPGKIELKMVELRVLQNREQDYFKK